MAEVTRKRTGQLLQKLFEILIAHPDGLQAGEALTKLRQSIELTEYEKGIYESGGSRFEKIVRFATVDCVKAGWILKHKGRWNVTDSGKAAHAKFKDPEAFYNEAVKLYNESNTIPSWTRVLVVAFLYRLFISLHQRHS
jgi:restriction system protein